MATELIGRIDTPVSELRCSGTPGHPHPAAWNGTRPQRQLQLQRRNRTRRCHPGRRPLRLQLRQHRQPQDGTETGRGTRLCVQRAHPVHRH